MTAESAALAAALGHDTRLAGQFPHAPADGPARPLPAETPPWVMMLQQNLTQSMSALHHKQDRSHKDLLDLGTEMQTQKVRVETLEKTARIHNDLHEQSISRISQLEKEVQDLRRSQTPPRGREPGSPRFRNDRSPPRSPSAQRERESEEELDIVVGGWRDARRSDAENEVQSLFQATGHDGDWTTIRAPYTRTSFVRVQLRFPDPDAPIAQRRLFQTRILDDLRKDTWTSALPDQNEATLWITKHRSPETRAKIRALVGAKEFFKSLPPSPNPPRTIPEEPEIDWRGKLWVGRYQVLGNAEHGSEVQAYDQFVPDTRGNHTSWFVSARAFSAATGYEETALQELWHQYGGDNRPKRNP